MGWVSLTLRKLSLRESINSHELRDIQISRQMRSIHRALSYDQSVHTSAKKLELQEAKEAILDLRDRKPEDYGSNEYNEWYQEYTDAQTDYQEEKMNINEYYDEILNEIEEESTDEETILQEEQTSLEAQLESMRSEFDAVKEQISSDIENTTLKLS